ncbi:GH39 family glycosyl hydrolase [Clostridium algidicarnis]|uniref:GH39 family glycosyl hydrolase n=1 Tax=Clostridium algidicarnis TaxID=37659 RepID=UPI00209A801D|nr:helix-turn-helix domain-containing protein [Clostridium algidicarnis]
MSYKYEFIMGDPTLPIKTIIHSVDGFDFHWHDKVEIILVLEGSVNVSIGKEVYLLQENDLVLINSNELHSTRRTKDENVLLALQIDPEFYKGSYPMFKNIVFNCKSYLSEICDDDKFNTIRCYIANIVWTLNKKNKGYELIIGSYLYLLAGHLINNFQYEIIESKMEETNDKDIIRINNILNYVNENFEKNITLKEVSEKEHLNYHFLSHFIKDKIGMSFQDYLNTVRLNNGVNLLVNSEYTITNIASISGFPSVNSFNRLFKKEYNRSPSEYRQVLVRSNHETFKGRKESKKIGTYLDVNRNDALKKLYKYLSLSTIKDEDTSIGGSDVKIISIDGNNEGNDLIHYWNKMITFGRASEGLRNNFQLQLRELQSEVGFDYIRFHGIFMDEMMIYNISNKGKVEYNWSYVDNLFDLFKEVNIKPFIELSFMPSELKSTEDTVFFWKGNISPPKDINLWTSLVKELIKHCINRYGLKEVETWYFEVWNEPEYEYFFWAGSKEEYFNFYKNTTLAIKSISGKLKVGGPAITHGTILTSSYLQDFLSYCNNNDILLDFVSLHIYPEYISLDDMDISLFNNMDSRAKLEMAPSLKKIYTDKDNTLNTLNIVNNKILEELNYKPEINVTEWNASSLHGNFIHDTSYVAAFIIKNVLQCIGATTSLGYWTFTDLMEENKLGISSFHGGFGLLNKEGLKKPSYYAYYLLSKLGDKVIDQGEDYIITKKDESIQILAYNYVYFDDLFLHGDESALTHKERYLIYEEKPVKEIKFSIKNIAGYYKITKYKLNRESGSVFDKWIELGATENMTKEELKYLQGKSQPEIEVSELKLLGEYNNKINVPVHGVELIILEKRV